MTLSAKHGTTDLHKENSAFFFRDQVLAFLRSLIGPSVLKLLCGNEGNLCGKERIHEMILSAHIILGLLDGHVNTEYRLF